MKKHLSSIIFASLLTCTLAKSMCIDGIAAFVRVGSNGTIPTHFEKPKKPKNEDKTASFAEKLKKLRTIILNLTNNI